MDEDTTPIITLQNVDFSYTKNHVVLHDLSIAIKRHAFTSILGPSGSGKTTLLKMLAGFLLPTSGTLNINGSVSLIFQDYSLFPHLTVMQNILYGLKLQKKPKLISRKEHLSQLNKLALQMTRILGITELLNRYPNELSGGQQQRVALARALVLKKDVILMDEPLSSLDEKLRVKLREELRILQKHLSLTIIYVTHDTGEALSMSDEIAVLNDGAIIQCGTPKDLYFHPTSKFSASFIGGANFLDKDNKIVMVRPEWINICEDNNSKYTGTIISKIFCGALIIYKVQLSQGVVTVELPSIKKEYNAGDKVSLVFNNECVL